jgi:tRNA(Ile)-lysidine synthetase-like protein
MSIRNAASVPSGATAGVTWSRMEPLLEALERSSATGLIPEGASVLLAVSGGADSLALLYGSAEASPRTRWRLCVAHVHHGWRGREADRDLAFVADHARRLGLSFFHRRRDARHAASELGLSPEAAARHVRYAALAEMAREAGATLVATAHQRDDAVESLLLAKERRGGLARLAGPRALRDDGVVRPLLGVGRREILAFLAARGLAHRRDATNGDLALSRNRVRRGLTRASEEKRAALAVEVSTLARARERLDEEYASRIAPLVRRDVGRWTSPRTSARTSGSEAGEGLTVVEVDARVLSACPDELVRLALSRLAGPFARAGRPPMTGPERERIVSRLRSGEDFRFEAGRRIRFERRGGRLCIRLRDATAEPVYDAAESSPRLKRQPS